MLCVNCKANIPEDSMFCMQCGTRQPEQDATVFVGGAQPAEDATVYVGSEMPEQEPVFVAPSYEAPQEEAAPAYGEEAPAYEEPAPVYADAYAAEEEFSVAPAKPKGKGLMFALIGVAVVVVGVILALLLGGKGGSKEASYGLYIKDDEVFYSNLKKDKEWQVTSRLIDTDIDYDGYAAEISRAIGMYTTVTEDGKLIFFPDKIGDSEGATLYYRPLNKQKADATKIDSDVMAYVVNEDASLITYVKGEAGNLYQYSMKSGDKEKVASAIEDFYVSDDGKKVGYMDEDGDLYFVKNGGDKEKLDSKISYIYSFSEDFKTVYYEKDETLYKMVIGEDKEKIASDVYSVLKIYESGEIYYVQSEESTGTLADYINDDVASSDAAMTEPEWPEEPYYWDFESDEEYEEAYAEWEIVYEEYEAAYDEYYAKLNRDDIRAQMEEYEIVWDSYSLSYFDGKESVTLSEEFAYDWNTMDYAADKAVMIYGTSGSGSKVKMSEVSDIWDAEYQVYDKLNTSGACFIAVGGEVTELSVEEPSRMTVSADGKSVYYMANIPEEENYGELYSMSVSGNKIGEPTLYDEEVYAYWMSLTEDGSVLYFKDVADYTGELYKDAELVDYDVSLEYVEYDSDNDRVIYYVDWDEENQYGTLKISAGKKAEKVNDDVNDFISLPNGAILYLYEYDLDHYVGELRIFQKGESEKLDEDVSALIPVYSYKYKGQY